VTTVAVERAVYIALTFDEERVQASGAVVGRHSAGRPAVEASRREHDVRVACGESKLRARAPGGGVGGRSMISGTGERVLVS
jgi:hypothetical protein